jgi:hydroxyacylglutathione hydrolase
MIVQPFPSGPFQTNAYVVACPATKVAAIIDPAPDSFAAISSYLQREGFTPDKILLTHSHWDHIADTAAFKSHYLIPVFIHPLDATNLEHPGSDGLPCWITIEGVIPDGYLNEGDIVSVGTAKFEVIHTPGHTPGGICLYDKQNGILLSGDTVFKGTIGNLSFSTGRPDLMWNSLNKLSKLPPETKIYPGHGPDTTIKNERWLRNAKQIFGNNF